MWLILAIAAYAGFALSSLGNKILLAEPSLRPMSYAFFVILFSNVLFLGVLAWGWPLPDGTTLITAVLSGAFFALSLVPQFTGIERYEVSRIVPATGGLSPLILFFILLAVLPGSLKFSLFDLAAFVLLIFGTVFISYDPSKPLAYKPFIFAVWASIFMALAAAFLKYSFISGFFWSSLLWRQVGSTLVIFFFLLSPQVRKDVLHAHPTRRQKNLRTSLFSVFLGFQAAGGAAIILQNAALYLAPARFSSFVYALQGLEYAFLFVLAALVSFRRPGLLHEKNSRALLVNKLAAIVAIAAGVALIAI